MGVSGAGKTEIGRALAEAIGWPFCDADEYHSPENIPKMHRGEGLTDADRGPWLDALHELTLEAYTSGRSMVLACSALKQSYRERLRPAGAPRDAVRFVYLDVPRAVLEDRLRTRHGHFATIDLLDSQLATLEPPREALWVDGAATPDEIVRRIRAELHL
jgi:gluconokinase